MTSVILSRVAEPSTIVPPEDGTEVTPLTRSEVARKIVHVGFGLGAVLLRWLTTTQAAAVAALAILFNLFVLPRVGGKTIARTERGYDTGIVLYPVAVLLLIVIFHRRPEIAAAVWILLAFGDGMATVGGRSIPSPRLPWNRDKSVAGSLCFLMAAVPAYLIAVFVGREAWAVSISAAIVIATLVCAIVESLPTRIDDNLTVPLAGGLTLAGLAAMSHWPDPTLGAREGIWLAVNAALAIAGYLVRSVDLSGALGGWILGAILILFAGWPAYLALLIFFAIGSAVTKLGYRQKAARGLAQEEGGRRGFSHAFANVGVAAILALLVASTPSPATFYLAALGALATAGADTTASEIGPLLGRRTFLPLSLRTVAPGTEGAISLEGTLAGILAAAAVASGGILAASMQSGVATSWKLIALVTLCGAGGSLIESLVGGWNRTRSKQIPNGVLNFFNTMAGAALVMLTLPLAR